MDLTLDLGNSAVKAALYDGTERVRVVRAAWTEPWEDVLGGVLAEGPSRCALASVVPGRVGGVAARVRAATGQEPLRVSPALRLPFRMAYATPQTLGADRLAAAVAAWSRYAPTDRPVVAIDAGTATTVEVVTPEPAYVGGTIAPGPRLLAEALTSGTAQLPDVAPAPAVLGDSTHGAIAAGVWASFVGGVRETLRHVEARYGRPHVVLTGGWAEALRASLDVPADLAPHLVLDGVRYLLVLHTTAPTPPRRGPNTDRSEGFPRLADPERLAQTHPHLLAHYDVLRRRFPWHQYERTLQGDGELWRHPGAPPKEEHEHRHEEALAALGHRIVSLPENFPEQEGQPPDIEWDGQVAQLRYRKVGTSREPGLEMGRKLRDARYTAPVCLYVLAPGVRLDLLRLEGGIRKAFQADERLDAVHLFREHGSATLPILSRTRRTT